MLQKRGAASPTAKNSFVDVDRRISFILTKRKSLRLNELWAAWVSTAFSVPATWVYPVGGGTQPGAEPITKPASPSWSYERCYRTMDWFEEAQVTTHTIVTELVPARFEIAHGARLLCAIAAGHWVLRASYLRASSSAGRWLDDESDHEWAASGASLRADEKLVADAARWWRESLQRGACERLLQRQRVYVFRPACACPPDISRHQTQSTWTFTLAADLRAMQAILRSAGATLCGTGSDLPAPAESLDLVVSLHCACQQSVPKTLSVWSEKRLVRCLSALDVVDKLLQGRETADTLANCSPTQQPKSLLDRSVAHLTLTERERNARVQPQQSTEFSETRLFEQVAAAPEDGSVAVVDVRASGSPDSPVFKRSMTLCQGAGLELGPLHSEQQKSDWQEKRSAADYIGKPIPNWPLTGDQEAILDSTGLERKCSAARDASRQSCGILREAFVSNLLLSEPDTPGVSAQRVAQDSSGCTASPNGCQKPIATHVTPLAAGRIYDSSVEPGELAASSAPLNAEFSSDQEADIAAFGAEQPNHWRRHHVVDMLSPRGYMRSTDSQNEETRSGDFVDTSPAVRSSSSFDEFDLVGLQQARALCSAACTEKMAVLSPLGKRKRRRTFGKKAAQGSSTIVDDVASSTSKVSTPKLLPRTNHRMTDHAFRETTEKSALLDAVNGLRPTPASSAGGTIAQFAEMQPVTLGLDTKELTRTIACQDLDAPANNLPASEAPDHAEDSCKADLSAMARSPASTEQNTPGTESDDSFSEQRVRLKPRSRNKTPEHAQPVIGNTLSTSNVLNVSFWLSLTRAFERALAADMRQWAQALPLMRQQKGRELPLFLQVAARNMRRVRRSVETGRLRVSAALEKRLHQHVGDDCVHPWSSGTWLHFDDAAWGARRHAHHAQVIGAFQKRLMRAERIRRRGRHELRRVHPGAAVASLVHFSSRRLDSLPPETRRRVQTLRRIVSRQWTRDAVASWSEAALKAWRDRHENANAYYYRHTDPGEFEGEETQSLHTWTPAERQQFFSELARWRANHWRLGTCWGIFSKAIPSRCGYQCSNFYRSCIRSGDIHDPTYGFNERGELKRLYPDREDPDTYPPPDSLNCLSAIWQWPEIQGMERQVDLWIRELHPRFALGLVSDRDARSVGVPHRRHGARVGARRKRRGTDLSPQLDNWTASPLERQREQERSDHYPTAVDKHLSVINMGASALADTNSPDASLLSALGPNRAGLLNPDLTNGRVAYSNPPGRLRGCHRAWSRDETAQPTGGSAPSVRTTAFWASEDAVCSGRPEQRRHRSRLRRADAAAPPDAQSNSEDDASVSRFADDLWLAYSDKRRVAADALDAQHQADRYTRNIGVEAGTKSVSGIALVQRARPRSERAHRLERILVRLRGTSKPSPLPVSHRTRLARQVALEERDDEEPMSLSSSGPEAVDWRLQRLRQLVRIETLPARARNEPHAASQFNNPKATDPNANDTECWRSSATLSSGEDRPECEAAPAPRRRARKPPQTQRLPSAAMGVDSTAVPGSVEKGAEQHAQWEVWQTPLLTTAGSGDDAQPSEATTHCPERATGDAGPLRIAGLSSRRIQADAVEGAFVEAQQSRIDCWRPQSLSDHILRIGQMLSILTLSLTSTGCARWIQDRMESSMPEPTAVSWHEHPECIWPNQRLMETLPDASIQNQFADNSATNSAPAEPRVLPADEHPNVIDKETNRNLSANLGAAEQSNEPSWSIRWNTAGAHARTLPPLEDWCQCLKRLLGGIRDGFTNTVDATRRSMTSWSPRASAGTATPSMSNVVGRDIWCQFTLWNSLRPLLRVLVRELVALYWSPGHVLFPWLSMSIHRTKTPHLAALAQCIGRLMQLVAMHTTVTLSMPGENCAIEPHMMDSNRSSSPQKAGDAFWHALMEDLDHCLAERWDGAATETSSTERKRASAACLGTRLNAAATMATWTDTDQQMGRAALKLLFWLLCCREALAKAPMLITSPACWQIGASALASSQACWCRLAEHRNAPTRTDMLLRKVLIGWHERALGCCAQLWARCLEQRHLSLSACAQAEVFAPLLEQALLLGSASASRMGLSLSRETMVSTSASDRHAVSSPDLHRYDGCRRSWRLHAHALDEWAASTLMQRRWMPTIGAIDDVSSRAELSARILTATAPADSNHQLVGAQVGDANAMDAPAVLPGDRTVIGTGSPAYGDGLDLPVGIERSVKRPPAAADPGDRDQIMERIIAAHFGLLRTSLDMLACWMDLCDDASSSDRLQADESQMPQNGSHQNGRGLEQRWLQSLRATLAPLWQTPLTPETTDHEWMTIVSWVDRTQGAYVFYLYGMILLSRALDERERRALYRQLRNRCPMWIQPTLLRAHGASLELFSRRIRYAEQMLPQRVADEQHPAGSAHYSKMLSFVRIHAAEWIAVSRTLLTWLDEVPQQRAAMDASQDHADTRSACQRLYGTETASHAVRAPKPIDDAPLPIVFANRALVQRQLRNRVAQMLTPALRQWTDWVQHNESPFVAGVDRGPRCLATRICWESFWQALPWYWSMVIRVLQTPDGSQASRLSALHGFWTTGSGVLLQVMHLIQVMLECALSEQIEGGSENALPNPNDPSSDATMLVDWEIQTQRALLLHELGPSSERLAAFLELVQTNLHGQSAPSQPIGTLWFAPAPIQEAHAQLVALVVRLVHRVEGAAPAFRLLSRLTPMLIVRHGHLESWTGINAGRRRWSMTLLTKLVTLASPTVLVLSPAEGSLYPVNPLVSDVSDEHPVALSSPCFTSDHSDREAAQRLAAWLQQRLTHALLSGLVSWPLLWTHEQGGARERPASRLWSMLRPLMQTLCRYAVLDGRPGLGINVAVHSPDEVNHTPSNASSLPSWPLLLAWYAARFWCTSAAPTRERDESPLDHHRYVWLPLLANLRQLGDDDPSAGDDPSMQWLGGRMAWPGSRRRFVAALLADLVDELDALLTSALSWWQVCSRDRSLTAEHDRGRLAVAVLFQYLVELAGAILVLCPRLLRIPGRAPFWSRVIRIGRRALEEYGRTITRHGQVMSTMVTAERRVPAERLRLFWIAAVLRGLAQMDLVPNDVYYASFRRHLIAASLEQDAVDALVLGLWPGLSSGLSPASSGPAGGIVSRTETWRSSPEHPEESGELAPSITNGTSVADDVTTLLTLLDHYWQPESIFCASTAARMRLDRFQKEWLDEIRSQCLEHGRYDLCLDLLLSWQQGRRLVKGRCLRAHLHGEAHWVLVASALVDALWSHCMDRRAFCPSTETRRYGLAEFVTGQAVAQPSTEGRAMREHHPTHTLRFPQRWTWSIRLARCLIEWLWIPSSADTSMTTTIACIDALSFLLTALGVHLDLQLCRACQSSHSVSELSTEAMMQSMNQLVVHLGCYPSGAVQRAWHRAVEALARPGPVMRQGAMKLHWCSAWIRLGRLCQNECTWRAVGPLFPIRDGRNKAKKRGDGKTLTRLWLSRPRVE
jgi:hypothetical protein